MKKLLGTLLFIFVATNAPASDMNFEEMADFDDGDIPVDHVEIVHEHYVVDESGTLNPMNEGESDSGSPVNSETLPSSTSTPTTNSESNGTSPVNSETPPNTNSAGGSNGGKLSVNSTGMVKAHNKWRAMVGVNAIKWSKKLQDDALAWAEKIRKNCEMIHAPDLTTRGQGENIFYASPIIYSDGRKTLDTSVTPSMVVDAWGSEKAGWVNAPPHCDTSKKGSENGCGHYTQVVWKTTTEVGCAAVTCSDSAQLWVCRYSPAGNYVGEAPY